MGKALIGTRAHAKIALSLGSGNTPEGWERLGIGGMRCVYRHIPTNVVYKVERCAEPAFGNVTEARQAQRLRRIKWNNVRIPLTSLFSVNGTPVVAMEYVEGTQGTNSPKRYRMEARQEMFDKGKMADMHGLNFVFDENDNLVPIDLGSPTGGRDEYDPDGRVLTCGNGSTW